MIYFGSLRQSFLPSLRPSEFDFFIIFGVSRARSTYRVRPSARPCRSKAPRFFLDVFFFHRPPPPALPTFLPSSSSCLWGLDAHQFCCLIFSHLLSFSLSLCVFGFVCAWFRGGTQTITTTLATYLRQREDRAKEGDEGETDRDIFTVTAVYHSSKSVQRQIGHICRIACLSSFFYSCVGVSLLLLSS